MPSRIERHNIVEAVLWAFALAVLLSVFLGLAWVLTGIIDSACRMSARSCPTHANRDARTVPYESLSALKNQDTAAAFCLRPLLAKP